MCLAAEQTLCNNIRKIQAGDQIARETLIDDYRPFILKTAVQFSKRMLVWGQDDELSIGLIAFDSAVNSFDPDREIPFPAYCRVVIINRLKDYARTQVRYRSLIQLDDETVNHYYEGQLAQEEYLNISIAEDRREELELLEEMLAAFSISFEDLAEVSPKHRENRTALIHAAKTLAQNDEYWNILTIRKQLPLNELEKACGVKRKAMERGRKFIIASAVILHNLDQFIYLNSYINVG